MGRYVQLVVVVTIQLDIGHDGVLYPCLSHGSWRNRVILGQSSMILPLFLGVQLLFVPWFLLRFAGYYGKRGRLYIRLAVSPSQLLGGAIL